MSGRGRVLPCGRTDGQSDMTLLTVAFRNSANRKCQKACLGFDVF